MLHMEEWHITDDLIYFFNNKKKCFSSNAVFTWRVPKLEFPDLQPNFPLIVAQRDSLHNVDLEDKAEHVCSSYGQWQ